MFRSIADPMVMSGRDFYSTVGSFYLSVFILSAVCDHRSLSVTISLIYTDIFSWLISEMIYELLLGEET